MKRVSLSALAILALCLSLGGGALAAPPPLDYTIIDPRFDALPGTTTSRYWGIAAGAAYRIEVPAGWNGKLVLYAHGYRGTGPVLYVSNPVLREHFVRNGYAWAASSYSANFYDVRQGVLDTHALGGIFRERTGRAPSSTFVTGHSMGGHITGALIEQYPDAYVGALPMCGVMGDVALFDYFLDYNLVAQTLAGRSAIFPPPLDYETSVVPDVRAKLSSVVPTAFPANLNEQGERLRAVTEQRSGGTRPAFKETFEAWGNFLFGRYGDGTVNGIASGNVTTNLFTVYRFSSGDDEPTAAELALNRNVLRVAPDWTARYFHGADGMQNIVPVHATFRIPVLSLHTIGDLFVPLSMEQIYARRAQANDRADLLVQRAYRDVGHCGFKPQEEARAFADLVRWVENGEKPEGDELLDPEEVADPQFGCRFTEVTRAPYPACASNNSN
ncbi:MAG TPA: alpha/beta hydrolase [Myxococcales bacterium]|jgi:pimeloyl-ACP methyl ester carboxylesterase|nr:alpha/beta hydrolase [Myxococcales bacterium]